MNRELIFEAKGEDDIARIYDVDLSYRNLTFISSLKEFDKLRCLVLSFNYIQKIQSLQHLIDLRVLNLQNNSITKISGLDHNKNLRSINLSNNRIEKIQNVAHLINLQTFQLDNNYITKLTNLQYLKKLKSLFAKNNKIQTIDNLPAFSQLSSLCLSQNKIKNISNNLFNSSEKLIYIDLSHNQIQNTSFLLNLHNVEYLNLSFNNIKVLQTIMMKNLQTLQINHNLIQKLPLIATNFPELIAFNVSNNMICSEIQLMTCLSEANSLIELDFRQNPMHSETFQSAIQKIHHFDFLNGQVMTKAGAKYCKQEQEILQDLKFNKDFYGEDDEDIRKLKMQGFFNKEPQESKLKKNIDNPTFYDDLDKNYKDFMENDMKIKVMREHYLKLVGQYDIIGSSHILTEIYPETTQPKFKSEQQIKKQVGQKPKTKCEQLQQLEKKQHDLRKQNEKNLNKWKDLKNKEKTFKIRDVIKSRGKDGSTSKGLGSTMTIPQFNSTSITSMSSKQQKTTKELLKTQLVPKKIGQQLFKPLPRPSSMRKKE